MGQGCRFGRCPADDLYLDEIRHCDILCWLFGNDCGSENAGVVSPAGREFDLAAAEGK